MQFNENNKAIYLQIADKICDDILDGVYPEDERIPSVREYAAAVEVNANTVMRTYETLSNQEIIFNKRGVGYFISPGARARVLDMRRRQFFSSDINQFFRQLQQLDVAPEQLSEMYKKYLSEK